MGKTQEDRNRRGGMNFFSKYASVQALIFKSILMFHQKRKENQQVWGKTFICSNHKINMELVKNHFH
jgi:hypothetical protein